MKLVLEVKDAGLIHSQKDCRSRINEFPLLLKDLI